MMPDATLNYWADRFVASGVVRWISFERFIALSIAQRETILLFGEHSDHLQVRMERQLPDAALHNGTLIDPFHHGVRRVKRPWFRNDREHI